MSALILNVNQSAGLFCRVLMDRGQRPDWCTGAMIPAVISLAFIWGAVFGGHNSSDPDTRRRQDQNRMVVGAIAGWMFWKWLNFVCQPVRKPIEASAAAHNQLSAVAVPLASYARSTHVRLSGRP
jgi:hypothetical protein